MYKISDDLEKLSLDEFMNLNQKSKLYREYLEFIKLVNLKKDSSINECENEIELYKRIVKIVANYIEKNAVYKNPLSYCGALSELVSKENIFGRFVINEDTYDEDIYGVNGATIVTGKGCCRHIASFFNDVLNEIGINSQYMYARTISGGEDNSMIFEHVFNAPVLSSNMTFENDDNTLERDHSVVMFHYEDKIFAYDPLNFLLFNVTGIEAKSLRGNYKMYICPYSYISLYGYAIQTAQNEVKYLSSFKDIYDDYQEVNYLKLVNIAAEKFNEKKHTELRDDLQEPITSFKNARYNRVNGLGKVYRLNK